MRMSSKTANLAANKVKPHTNDHHACYNAHAHAHAQAHAQAHAHALAHAFAHAHTAAAPSGHNDHYKKDFYDGVKTLSFRINDFAAASIQPNALFHGIEVFQTETLEAHGHPWCLTLITTTPEHTCKTNVLFVLTYAGGGNNNKKKKKYQQKNLQLPIDIRGAIRTKTTHKQIPRHTLTQKCQSNFASRLNLFNNELARRYILRNELDDNDNDNDSGDNGTTTTTTSSKNSWTVMVDIEVATERRSTWYPPMPVTRHEDFRTKLYASVDNTGDISFAVGGGDSDSDSDSSAAGGREVVVFKAHKAILKIQAESLYEFVLDVEERQSSHNNNNNNTKEDNDDDDDDDDDDADYNNNNNNLKTSIVALPNENPKAFGAMLEFVYMGKEPTFDDFDNMYNNNNNIMEMVRSVLRVADRFGCTELKLYTESVLTDKFLDVSNAASMLLFADSFSCALLKEAAMDTYVSNPSAAILQSSDGGWSMVEESPRLLLELIRYKEIDHHRHRHHHHASRCCRFDDDTNNSVGNNNNRRLGVRSLREQLQEIGGGHIPLDGNYEILVERLNEHKN